MDLKIRFLDNPPYQSHWWPWSETHFRIETSLINATGSAWLIHRMLPCNDCTPKFYLEDVETDTEPKRTREADVFYVLKNDTYFALAPDSCYVDTIDVASWIEYDLSRRTRYRLWLEFEVWAYEGSIDPTRVDSVWSEVIVSDTLEFVY